MRRVASAETYVMNMRNAKCAGDKELKNRDRVFPGKRCTRGEGKDVDGGGLRKAVRYLLHVAHRREADTYDQYTLGPAARRHFSSRVDGLIQMRE